MLDVLLFILTIAALAVVLLSAARPGGYLTFPVPWGGVILFWVVPQVWTLRSDPYVPHDGLECLVCMALFCFFAGIAGWHWSVRRRVQGRWPRLPRLPVGRLIVPLGLLTAFVFAMHVGIQMQPEEAREATQWSGPITIFAFFAQLRIVALTLSLLMVLTRRTPATVALAAANLAITLPVAFVGLRREEMVDVSLAVAGALWFARRISLPLPAVAIGGLGLAIVVFSIGELRSASSQIYRATGERPFLLSPELIQSVAFRDATAESLVQAPDIRNAVHIIEYTDLRDAFALGGNTWNDFVHQWVPGQIVGRDLKSGLMVSGWRSGTYEGIYDLFRFKHLTGTTATGFGSAYQDFGYFGSIYFLAIGAILGKLFRRARAGDPWFQTLFLAGTTLALGSVTHQHTKFFVALPLYLGVVRGLRWVESRVSSRGLRPKRRPRARSVVRRSLAMQSPMRLGGAR